MSDFLQIVLLIFIAAYIVIQKNEQVAKLFGKQRKIILDSCALIDGRIVEIVNSKFIATELVIPQFILNELQLLADGNDSHKRERARFGLDIAHQLQDTPAAGVVIERSVFPEAAAIDDKLVLLAKKLKAQLFTTDYNLSKVAAVEGVGVLNVNELAQSLRPITLPGETLSIKIIQRGNNRDQGVGYLEDGTMIVVDGGVRYLNKVVPVTVTRMHQTIAGKMVFGQVRSKSPEGQDKHSERSEDEKQPTSTETAKGTARTAAAASAKRSASAVSHSSQINKLHGRIKTLKRKRPHIQ